MAAGAATLFVELTLIRYVPGEIRVLGYFTNFVLFAAFLGIGVGILAARRWPAATLLSRLAPVALLVIVAAALGGERLHVAPSADEFLFLEYQTRASSVSLATFLTASFVLLSAGFVPLGHVVGRTLEGERPLLRYGLNIAGSLLGIGLFVVLSALGAPPFAWVLLAGALALVGLLEAPMPWRVAGLLAALAAAAVAAYATRDAVWSPYQKITTAPLLVHPELGVITEWRLTSLPAGERARLRPVPASEGFVIRVNEDSYQFPTDLSDRALLRRPGLLALRHQYDMAFRVRAHLGDVLVLGAGSGNDVAAALRRGARSVDAVEIDPTILALGARHPERPYLDPRVHAIVDDGRAYLARTDRSYDTIVFALIDSHVLASHNTNVRLDSFVFTRESFALARRHLKPHGVLVVSHAVGEAWFVARMQATLDAAFGRPPFLVSAVISHPLGVAYASGDRVPAGTLSDPHAEPLTDDWPFIYLRDRTIPSDYLLAMVLVALVSLAAVRGASGPRWTGVRLVFFALGGGFLLLETRGLAVLGVLAGNTWQSTSAVFAGVLVMALGATAVASRIPDRRRSTGLVVGFALLFAALTASFVVPVSALMVLPRGAGLATAALLVASPLLASGVVYALALALEGNADAALASNLAGALLGGLVEYASMLVGFRWLVALAAAFYAAAAIAMVLRPTHSRSGRVASLRT